VATPTPLPSCASTAAVRHPDHSRIQTEEEISGQDPLVTIDQTGQNGAQPGLVIVGGYTFGAPASTMSSNM